MHERFSAKGLTRIPDGLMWGRWTLDPRRPYSSTHNGKPRRQTLVLMTDGANMVVQTPGAVYNQNDEKFLGANVVARAAESTRAICENVNLMTDITIY